MQKRQSILVFLFLFSMLILIVPLLFSPFKSLKGPALFGKEDESFSFKHFTMKNFLNNSFQEETEETMKQWVGFSNYWTRSYNELMYQLFRYTKTQNLVLGQQDYFYEKYYIEAELGINFVGEEVVTYKTALLKQLQSQLLEQYNIHLLPIFIPGKGHVYPEYMPKRDLCWQQDTTNYERYIYHCNRLGVNYLDMNEYFCAKRKESEYPLYSKYGVHWNTYGLWTAVDTLMRFMEKSCCVNLAELTFLRDTISSEYKALDYDLEPTMNLLRPLPGEELCFPVYIFQSDSSTKKLRALTIADSYYWGFFNVGITNHLFTDEHQYWYYNRTPWPDIFSPDLYISDSIRKETIFNQEVILLMMTDANLYNFGWNFIEQTLNFINPDQKIDPRIMKINEYLSYRDNYNLLIQESKRKQIPFQMLLRQLADTLSTQK